MKTALLMMIGTTVAFAQPGPAKPTPPKELALTKEWLKTWSCNATNAAGEKVTGTLAFKKELDGFWVSMKLDTAKTKLAPAFSGTAMFGLDTMKNEWVMSGYDNAGGSLNLKSKVATATAMTWEGPAVVGNKLYLAKLQLSIDDQKQLKYIGEFGGRKAFEFDCK
jgi:hypothetical protein